MQLNVYGHLLDGNMIITNILAFLLIFGKCHSLKILAFLPVASRSHYMFSVKIVDGLARNGHEVTFVTSERRANPPENVTEILTKGSTEWLRDVGVKLTKLKHNTFYKRLQFLGYVLAGGMKYIFEDLQAQKFFDSGHEFDLTIVSEHSTTGFLAVSHHFKTPIVLLTSTALFPWTRFRLGYPDLPSWVSNIYDKRLEPGSFSQRSMNSVNYLLAILYDNYVLTPGMGSLVAQHFPEGPDLGNVLKNVDLVLTNTHMSNYEAAVKMPNIVEIGGYHIEPPQPLDQGLKRTLDLATNGVLIFAMGSHLKMSSLPNHTLQVFFEAFSELNQTVFMKWEIEELPETPANVRLLKWVPLNDILEHPNVKVFITHGGVFSMIEAVYYGVPVLGLPASLDQICNMGFAEFYGYGKVLDLKTLTREGLLAAITEMLHNPRFKEKVMLRSKIVRDRAVSSIDAVNYWVEYVVRRKAVPRRDFSHLQYPGVRLEWYQLYLLDVFLFIFTIVLIIYKGLSKLFSKLCPVGPVDGSQALTS